MSERAAPPRRVPLAATDLPAEGQARGVEIAPGRRLLVARVGGRLHALDDVCNHAGCLLSRGRIEGGTVVCPCHYMTFDLRDGRLLVTPRLADDQRSYPVVEEGGAVVVVLGD